MSFKHFRYDNEVTIRLMFL